MKKQILYRTVLLTVLLVLCISGISWGASISGTITNPTNLSGRVYVILAKLDSNNSHKGTGLGTSGIISASPGPGNTFNYTINGVPKGIYKSVIAYIDPSDRNNGKLYGGSILGSTEMQGATSVVVDSDVKSGINITLVSQGARTVAAPTKIAPFPIDGGLFVDWNGAGNSMDLEVADSYNVYWGTNSDVGPGKTTGGGSRTGILSKQDGHLIITGLTNTIPYYVAVEAVTGANKALARTAQAVTAGSPIGGQTVSVQVNTSIAPAKPLLVILWSQNARYGSYISAPGTSNNVTIAGVLPGTYDLYAIQDVNNNFQFDDGDLNLSGSDYRIPLVTVASSPVTIPAVTIADINSEIILNTVYSATSQSGVPVYSLSFGLNRQKKRPVHAVINSGPQITSPISIGYDLEGNLRNDIEVPYSWNIGDTYNTTITYSDSTQETTNLVIQAPLYASATPTFPIGNSGPDSINPRFSWNAPLPNSSDFYFEVVLQSNNGNDWKKRVPATQHSIQYDGPQLTYGMNYNWGIIMVNKLGNRTENWQQFTPMQTGVRITSITPVTLDCNAADRTVTIAGSGFNAILANNQVFFNTGTSITPDSASPTQLTVTMPGCSIPNYSTGPIQVVNTSNYIKASSNSDFTPTFHYQYYVMDWNVSTTPVLDVQVSVVNQPAIPAVQTGADGSFNLAGIPAGIPFVLRMSGTGLSPITSSYQQSLGNITAPSNTAYFTLPSDTYLSGLGTQAGKGLIRSRTKDSSGNNMTNVVVTAYSTKYNSYNKYTIMYGPETALSSIPLTATCDASNYFCRQESKYYVMNVEPDDVVIVKGCKTGYRCSSRMFPGQADTMGSSSINLSLAPTVTISSFTPASALPGTDITISGTGFNSATNGNSICFGSSSACTPPKTASATSLTVTVPCSALTGIITVNANGGTGESQTNFTIPSPTITGFTPSEGVIGSSIFVSGTNFSNCNNNIITFNGTPVTSGVQWSLSQVPHQFIVNVPFNATTGPVSIKTGGGFAVSQSTFIAWQMPTATAGSATPTIGIGGTAVTINGTFYDTNTNHYQITFNGVSIPAPTSVTSNSLTFNVPTGAYGSFLPFTVTYFNSWIYSGNFAVMPKLTINLVGQGTVTESSVTCMNPPNVSCNQLYTPGTQITLTATPSTGQGYVFNGWGGACAASGTSPTCNLVIAQDMSVTANFMVLQDVKVTPSNIYKATLQSALDTAPTSSKLLVRTKDYGTQLNYNRPGVVLTVSGGYDSGFPATHVGKSIFGAMTIYAGSLILDNLYSGITTIKQGDIRLSGSLIIH